MSVTGHWEWNRVTSWANGRGCDLCEEATVVGWVEVSRRDRSLGGTVAGSEVVYAVCLGHLATVGTPVYPSAWRKGA